jgi:flagellar biosynthesis component FlhA
LQSDQLQHAVTALLQQEQQIEEWLKTTAASGIDLSIASRDTHGYAPPRIELRVGAELRHSITEADLLRWHRQISDQLGLPVPTLTLSRGEIAEPGQDREGEREQHIDTHTATGYELELLIDGRLIALGDFYPDRYQTLKRHWEIARQEPPAGSKKSNNEALQECVVWLEKEYLDQTGWAKPSWSWDQAVLHWLHLSLRKHIHSIFTYYDLMPFINTLWSSSEARLNRRDFLRTIAGNFQALWQVLINLAREFVPLNKRTADLMLELQQLVRQSEEINTVYLTQKLREHVGFELCKMFTDETNQLPVLLMDETLEQELIDRLRIAGGRRTLDLTLDQGLKLASAVRGTFETILRTEDMAPVLVCEDNLRLPLFRMIQHFDSRIHVLSYTELSPEVRPTSKGIVSGVSLDENR